MASQNATPNAVYGQAFRTYGKIVSSSSGNPITGGLAGLAMQISKDGASFVNAANAPTEIGTSGYVALDLTSAEMSYSAVVIRVTATNSNAIEFSMLIPICNLQQFEGTWDAQSVLRVEQMIQDLSVYLYGYQNTQAGVQLVQNINGTEKATGTIASTQQGTIRQPLTGAA